MKSVTAQWAKDNAKNINLIDVRTPAEFNVKHVEGAKNVPMVGLILNHETFLEKDKVYYFMCGSGGRSSRTISELDGKGYELINVAGGISALK